MNMNGTKVGRDGPREWLRSIGGAAIIPFVIGLACGCGRSDEDRAARAESGSEQAIDVATAAQAMTAPISVKLPDTIGQSDVVLSATQGIAIADRARIVGGYVANTGVEELNIGVDARFSKTHAISTGLVRARGTNDKTAWIEGPIVTANNLIRENNAQVAGPVTTYATLGYTQFTRNVEFPDSAGPNISVNSGNRTLSAGNYGEVTVSGGTLTLEPGTYNMTKLLLYAGSTIVYKNSAQPVEINVKDRLFFQATAQEQATGQLAGNVRLTYLGSSDVTLETAWRGTLVATKAKITLATLSANAVHRGAVFAKQIEVRPDARVEYQPFPSTLITNVDVSPTTPCQNQPVTVTVTAHGATGASGETPPTVTINGSSVVSTSAGAVRQLQFMGTGPRKVFVTAASGGIANTRVVDVNIAACNDIYPRLVVTPALKPFELEFQVTNPNELAGSNRKFRWVFGDTQTIETADPWVSHSYANSVNATSSELVFQASLTVIRSGQPDVTVPRTIVIPNIYALMASRGFVRPLLTSTNKMTYDGGQLVGSFNLRNLETTPITFTSQRIQRLHCDPDLTPTFDSSTSQSVTLNGSATSTEEVRVDRSVYGRDICGLRVLWSGTTSDGRAAVVDAYFDTPSKPLLSYPLTDTATKSLLNDLVTSGKVSDSNHITLEELQILKNKGLIPKVPLVTNTTTGVLGGGDSLVGELCDPTLPNDHPELICQATEDWTVTPPLLRNALKGDLLLVSTCSIIGQMLRQVHPTQLYSHEGMMTRNYFSVVDNGASVIYMMKGVAGLGDRLNGNRLKYGWPGAMEQDISSAFDELWTPNPDGELELFEAFKPESVRCLNDPTPVPPLVVRPAPANEAAVRSKLTTLADWEKAIVGKIHYRTYGYTQANVAFGASGSFDGGDWRAPSDSSFPAVSSTLHWFAAKSNGVTLEGSSLESLAKPYQNKTNECDLGARLPTTNPGGSCTVGSAPNWAPGVVDGLYKYNLENRKLGLGFIYNETYNEVAAMQNTGAYDSLGWLGPVYLGLAEFFASAPSGQREGIAGQVSSCFALDQCGASNDPSCPCTWQYPPDGQPPVLVCPNVMSEKEKAACDPTYVLSNPGEGVTASPDNFLFWDGPEYGYFEFLNYRSGEFGRVHKWAPNPGTSGKCGGTVVYSDGTTVANALVVMQSNTTVTDPSGHFHFDALNVGQFEVRAQKEQTDGTLLWDTKIATVPANAECTPVMLTLKLDGPFEEMKPVTVEKRKVSFSGHLKITDDETWPFDNEYWDHDLTGSCSVWPGHAIEELNSGDTSNPFGFGTTNPCAGDEVKSALKIICKLDPADLTHQNVLVTVMLSAVEGTDCSGSGWIFDDPEASTASYGPAVLAPGASEDHPLNIYIEGGDKSDLTLHMTNGTDGTTVINPIQEVQRRRVVLDGTVDIKDDDWPDGDEWAHPVFHQECFVDPFSNVDVVHWDSPCVDSEVHATVDITCTLSPKDMTSVTVETKVKLYEGTVCGSTDLDGDTDRVTQPITACNADIASCPETSIDSPNSTGSLQVDNDDEGGDYIKLNVGIKNVKQ